MLVRNLSEENKMIVIAAKMKVKPQKKSDFMKVVIWT